jgi:hypothetical protein
MKLGVKRAPVSEAARQKYDADVTLAGTRPELLMAAGEAETRFRAAQARRAPVSELYAAAVDLDDKLTAAMQAAFAAQRAQIGPRGYDDRIYRRKGMAKPAVHKLTGEAEHLLTLRETHRLNNIPAEPMEPVV